MELKVHNIEGKAVKSITLPDDIYGVPMNEHVLHSVIVGYLANRRQGTHATKTRSTVSGGGRKPFRQKGTGNARQGSTRAHLYEGGAVAHGPQPRDYTQHLNRRTKRLALKIALSEKVRYGKLIVVDDFAVSEYSTKYILKVLDGFKTGKALLADERKDDFLYRSARNIHGSAAVAPKDLNAENVLRHETLIISETALNTLQQRLEEKKRASV